MDDRSEHGWVTVDEYVEDKSADNEDDDKHMFRAEARAGRKSKSVKNVKNKKVSMGQGPKKQSMRFFQTHPQAGPVPLLPPAGGSGMSQLVQPYVNSPLSQMGAKWRANLSGGSVSSFACFHCGKPGHFRKACPLLLGSGSK